MAQTTYNTQAFIESQQYSSFILRNLHDLILPTTLYRNVTDFGMGDVLNIKTIGAAQVQEVAENTPLVYNPIETGTVTLQITDYVGDAWYVTDILRQDGNQIEQLMAARAQEATQALAENFETRYLETANNGQTPSDLNLINGFAHRFVATGTNTTMSEDDLIDMRLAFDKANVREMGRIAIVDPVVAATFQKKVVLTQQVDMNPTNQRLLENGFDNMHRFVINLHGWNIWTSNFLPRIASETINSVTATNAVANIFMCVSDDQCKPLMAAWRQMPQVESERDMDRKRDKFNTTARWGLGVQRLDTLGVILASATATE